MLVLFIIVTKSSQSSCVAVQQPNLLIFLELLTCGHDAMLSLQLQSYYATQFQPYDLYCVEWDVKPYYTILQP